MRPSFFLFILSAATTDPYTSFPTRRSSDLDLEAVEVEQTKPGDPVGETPEAALIAKVDAEQLRTAISALPTPFRETRSEEHTSELQSRRDLVCRLLLEKKKRRR